METVKRKIRMLCVVFLGAELFVTALTGGVGTDEAIRGQDEYTPLARNCHVETNADADEIQKDLGRYTPEAGIRYVETAVAVEGNELIFGNLVIELPEGVNAGMEAAADTGQRAGQFISLDGAEMVAGETESHRDRGPFPPQIGMAHYTAEYKCEEALICALIDLPVGGNLRVLYEDQENNEYIFRLGSGDTVEEYYHYVFLRGEDLYLVGEFDAESRYSFSALREQGRVKWKDSGRTVDSGTDDSSSYFKIMPEEGVSFLFHGYDVNVYFYLEGYFDKCYDSFETGRKGEYFDNDDWIDINFDGCTDLSIDSSSALIWNPMEKEYTKVEYPEDMPFFWSRSFPGTKTVWCYDRNYLSDARDDHDMDYTESLWQWDGSVPVKRRECLAEVQKDGVRIRAYEDGADNLMFDESFTLEEWDSGSSEAIIALYEQFYDGYVPQDELVSGESGEPEKIPQEFLDELTDAMLSAAENDAGFDTMIGAMVGSEKLTDEECYAAAVKNEDIRVNVLKSWQGGSFTLEAADVDNDGIEDVLGEFFMGGDGGSVSYILFQGQTDGTYIETDSFYSVKERFGIVEYDGKNHLVRSLYDYGKKFFDGFCVTLYEEGRYTEEAYLMLYLEDYSLLIVSSERGYEDFAGQVMGQAVLYDGMVEEAKTIMGSAEEQEEYRYLSDLDNDGELEYYEKDIWTSTNSYARNTLMFFAQNESDEGILLIQEAIQERNQNGYYEIMLWVDELDGGTVVNVMYQTDLYDFVIVGYVVDGREPSLFEVYEIVAEAGLGVRQTRLARSEL